MKIANSFTGLGLQIFFYKKKNPKKLIDHEKLSCKTDQIALLYIKRTLFTNKMKS